MQIISKDLLKNYNRYVGKKSKKIKNVNCKTLTTEIIENLKQAEKEINEGKVIPAQTVFKLLREKHEC